MISISSTGFSLFGLQIRYYGALIALGIALAIALAARREGRLGLPKDTALDLALIGVPAAIVGARLYYVIFSWDSYASNPISALYLWEGGLAIYGGLLGGLLAGFIYARAKHLPFMALADLAAPSFALGQAIGRWGNFFNQEAYGIAVTNPALQRFPIAVFIQADGQWHCATFFYESAWCALIVPLRHRAGAGGGPAHRQPLLGPGARVPGAEHCRRHRFRRRAHPAAHKAGRGRVIPLPRQENYIFAALMVA